MMLVFFGLMVVFGVILCGLDLSATAHSDSIPAEFAGHTGLGLAMICVGAIGAGCVAAF